MKKIIALLLAMSILFALTACGGNDESTPTGESTGATTNATESTNHSTDGTEDETQGTTEGTTDSDATDTTRQPTTTPPTTTPPTTTPPTTTPTTTPPTTGAAHTHSYSSKVTTAASCDKEGVKTFTCSCGHSYTEKIAATGQHSWKPATCTAPKTCNTCGKTDGSKAGHNYVQGACSGCGISSAYDMTGPQYTTLSITPNPAKLGGQVTIRVKITDESGVLRASVQLYNIFGNAAGGNLSLVEGDSKNGIYEGTVTLPTDTPAGEWRADILAQDVFGYYGPSYGDSQKYFTVTAS